ncbi:MAG: cytochrome ubiquinol oxidase subunit I, partial [Planctomycetes bacterium]|nr:cytochrome ubiquinol oxidase subunit I [Planctomycetota bacterium]
QAYHLMVGLGMFFIAVTWLAVFFQWRGTLFRQRWLMGVFVVAVVAAVVANQAGWVAAEVGRQPWVVHPPLAVDAESGAPLLDASGRFVYEAEKGLRTRDAVSPVVRRGEVLGSLIGFGLVYLLLGLVWLFVLFRKIHLGPEPITEDDLRAPPREGGPLAGPEAGREPRGGEEAHHA